MADESDYNVAVRKFDSDRCAPKALSRIDDLSGVERDRQMGMELDHAFGKGWDAALRVVRGYVRAAGA
jgi:hypothetical protein